MMYDYFGPFVGFTVRLRIAVMAVVLCVFGAVVLLDFHAGIKLPGFVVELALALGVVLGIILAIIWHSKTGYEDN